MIVFRSRQHQAKAPVFWRDSRAVTGHSQFGRIAQHAEMARELARHPVQVRVVQRGHSFELTVITADRRGCLPRSRGSWLVGHEHHESGCLRQRRRSVLDIFRFSDLYKDPGAESGRSRSFARDSCTCSKTARPESLLRARQHPRRPRRGPLTTRSASTSRVPRIAPCSRLSRATVQVCFTRSPLSLRRPIAN